MPKRKPRGERKKTQPGNDGGTRLLLVKTLHNLLVIDHKCFNKIAKL
jgi:hypothetical protein